MKLKKDFLCLPKGRIGLQKVKIKQTNIKLPWHPWWQRPFAIGESPNHVFFFFFLKNFNTWKDWDNVANQWNVSVWHGLGKSREYSGIHLINHVLCKSYPQPPQSKNQPFLINFFLGNGHGRLSTEEGNPFPWRKLLSPPSTAPLPPEQLTLALSLRDILKACLKKWDP